MKIVMNAIAQTTGSSHSMSLTLLIIMIPTMTSAPTVHADVNVPKNPEKNNATMKRAPTTIGMSPVLAPTLIPVVDSMNDVVVDVPQTAPAIVATASHVSALLPSLR